MKIALSILMIAFTFSNAQAQLLKKIKQKAEEVANKVKDKPADKKEDDSTIAENGTDKAPTAAVQSNLKVYSKFDFVPGATILYYDNFEKDNIGEAPLGWITSTSAEVVTIDGLEAVSYTHLLRSN